MDTTTENVAQTTERLVGLQAKPELFQVADDGGRTLLILHKDMVAHDVTEKMPEPPGISRSEKFASIEDFIAYTHLWVNQASIIKIDRAAGRVVAIFDYHGKDSSPAWCRHTAELTLTLSPEWKAWTNLNGTMLSQVDFANFVEDHAKDVLSPAAGDVIQMALTLRGTTKATFASEHVRETGDAILRYEVATKAAMQEVDIPSKLRLALPLWDGSDPEGVDARLCWRPTDEGRVRFAMQFIGLDEFRNAQTRELQKRITEETETPAYIET